jgi:uncharacterized protein YdgA (DUF945 family)
VKRPILLFITVVIFAAIAVSAAPIWFGIEAEKAYQRLTTRPAPGGVTIRNGEYTRGWLGSTAETVIDLPNAPFELTATHHIHHGPLRFARLLRGEFDLTPVQAVIDTRISITPKRDNATLRQVLAELPELRAETVVHLGGDGVTHLDLPAIKRTSENGGTLDWRGLSGDIRFDGDFKRFTIAMHSPGVVVTGAPGKGGVTIGKFDLRSDLQEGPNHYLLGDSDFTVDQVALGDNVITLDGFAFHGGARATGDNLNVSLRYRLKGLQFLRDRSGPGELAVELRNLDSATLRRFDNELDAIGAKHLPRQQMTMVLTGRALELVAALARNSPELEVTKLSFKSGDGELTGHAKVIVAGNDPNLGQNPMALLMAVHGDAELSLPPEMLKPILGPLIERDLVASAGRRGGISREELAKMTPETRSRIVEQAIPLYLPKHEFTRLLVPDNGRYKFSATLNQGQFMVNGKPWTPGEAMPVASAGNRVR